MPSERELNMAEVHLSHIYKRFGGVEVVKDANLEVRDGEFLVLVGPSGCGKTTLLRMIAGLEEISSGELRIGDRVVNDIPPKDRDIAMVFQNYALYPHMSVYDNIACTLRWRNAPKQQIDPRVREAADILELTPYLDRKPKALSGGQRQRVALARAIVREPKVFLMDEPLSNLDARLRVQTRAEISKLHQRFRRTTIYVTHDQTEAMTMGDRIAVVNNGVIQQIGAPQDLYTKPVNLFVATFIGSPSMNMFRQAALSKASSGALTITTDTSTLELPMQLSQLLSGYNQKSVTFGVRPEDLELTPDTSGALKTTVEVVENLGSEKLLYTKSGATQLLVRVGPSVNAVIGDTLYVKPKMENLHFFDSETGKSLLYSSDGVVAPAH